MTVRVNKPPIDLRSKLSELERPTGLKGNELMRAETAQEARDLVSAGRKNALYNGDMQIWQRGTTFNNSGAGGAVNYTADRWNSTRYASTENDTTREDANYLGFRYCLRSARSNGDTTTTARYVHQVLEQKDTWKLRGNYVTFSYYARVGSGFNGGFLGTYMTYHTDSAREERFYYNQFINGNNSYAYITHYDISTEWKRYSFTRFLPDNAQQIGVSIGSNQNLPTSTGGDYFEITGCQLEVGKNATDFEHRSYGEELALCERYFQKYSKGSLMWASPRSPQNVYTDFTYGVFKYRAPMRAAPTVGVIGSNFSGVRYNGSGYSTSNIALSANTGTGYTTLENTGADSTTIRIDWGFNWTINDLVNVVCNNTDSALTFSAEL